MPAPIPSWRRLFDRIENSVGRPLEQAISDPRVNELLMMGLDLSKSVQHNWRAGTANLLHLRNRPSYSDIRRVERRPLAAASAHAFLGFQNLMRPFSVLTWR